MKIEEQTRTLSTEATSISVQIPQRHTDAVDGEHLSFQDDNESESSYTPYEMPEGSPAFESILTELVTKLESTHTYDSLEKFDDSVYHWVPDDPPSKKNQVRFIDGVPGTNSDQICEISVEPKSTPSGRTQSVGYNKPPRSHLRRSNSQLSPIIRKGPLNRFPLRKPPASCSSTPLNSPLLPRNKSTRIRPKSSIVQPTHHKLKYVFQTITTSVSHEDLIMEKQNNVNQYRAPSMFETNSLCNPDIYSC